MESNMDQLINSEQIDIASWASCYEKETGSYYSWNQSLIRDFKKPLFDLDVTAQGVSPGSLNGERASESGRGKIKRLVVDSENFVLRHFYRGGWVRHFSRDLYILPPTSETRVEGEVKLLQKLRKFNLAVPEPAAIKIQRLGVFCRMDILLKEIKDARNLVEVLRFETIKEDVWRDIGRTIQSLHQINFFHADLNAHNILLDKNNKVWLVDFDKSCFMNLFPWIWKKQNLGRLHRSLSKEKACNATFYFENAAWGNLLLGYQAS